MANELAVFHDAVKEQMPVLMQSTGLNQKELESKLISFAYATKNALEKVNVSTLDKQSIKEAFKASLDTGIPVDKRQLAYVIKYGNTIQYHIGYKGFISRIKESIFLSLTDNLTGGRPPVFLLTKFQKIAQMFDKILISVSVCAIINSIARASVKSFLPISTLRRMKNERKQNVYCY